MEIYKKAEELFKSKQYSEVIDLCSKEKPNWKMMTLMARSFMLMTNYKNWGENSDAYYEAASNAFKLASTLDEVIEIEYQLRHTIRVWDGEQQKILLEKVRRSATMKSWKECLESQQNYRIAHALTLYSLRRNPNILKLCEENGISEDDRSDLFDKKSVDNAFPSEEINALQFNIGCKIYENTVNAIEENKNASKEFLAAFGEKAIDKLYLVDQLLSGSIDYKSKDKVALVERLYKYAEVLDYMLRVRIYPLGYPMSLIQGDRSELYKNLKKIYGKIEKRDPAFVMPELPDLSATKLPTTPTSNTGGCYVATAVYGSYDCPEVWTLRRFRDYILAETWYGRAFIRTYYAVSPTLVKWFGKTEWFKNIWKPTLDRMVNKLNKTGIADTPYNDRAW